MTGWNMPPGCSRVPGDEPEPPCEVCGRPSEDCICPECPVCGSQGDPGCYEDMPRPTDKLRRAPRSRPVHAPHGLHCTLQQKIGQSRLRIAALEDLLADETMHLQWLESQREVDDGFALGV